MTARIVRTAEGLHKKYRMKSALRGLSLQAHRDECFGIPGPAGAGTLIEITAACGLRLGLRCGTLAAGRADQFRSTLRTRRDENVSLEPVLRSRQRKAKARPTPATSPVIARLTVRYLRKIARNSRIVALGQ